MINNFIKLAVGVLFLFNCNTVDNRRLSSGETRNRENKDSIFIKYLGTGGILIKWKDSVIMTAPFYSNQSIPRLCLSQSAWCLFPLVPDHEHINLNLSKIPEIGMVKAILVAHSHYDHLLDVPCVIDHIRKVNPSNDPVVYGSNSMLYLLRSIKKYKTWEKCVPSKPLNLKVINDKFLSKNQKPGQWIKVDKRIRFMAVKSEHAPHVFGIDLLGKGKKLNKVPDNIPDTPRSWVVGEVYTFIIDLLDEDGETIKFRILFQDSASNFPIGSIPNFELKDQKKVDFTFLCMPAFDQVKNNDYPEKILLKTKPRYVMAGHWESFFHQWKPDGKADYTTVPFLSYEEFFIKMKKALPKGTVELWPKPGSGYYLLPEK